eukprot:GABV01009384.1.p1 GENE.GABV01009384.1~~GABV01009384.1.p1  ORF type:complete len:147 (+),score=34.63 GABV01009384.1:269-709(+)
MQAELDEARGGRTLLAKSVVLSLRRIHESVARGVSLNSIANQLECVLDSLDPEQRFNIEKLEQEQKQILDDLGEEVAETALDNPELFDSESNLGSSASWPAVSPSSPSAASSTWTLVSPIPERRRSNSHRIVSTGSGGPRKRAANR